MAELSTTLGNQAALPDLRKVVSELEAHYGPPQPPIATDPFELVLLENVGYLVSDKRREEGARATASARKTVV
jgi:hypothetical protein